MQQTPLYNEHVKCGAKIVDFNGWALPLQFTGIVQEHHHTRNAVSIFDCSHMGEYLVQGSKAIERYTNEIISDVAKIPVSRCRYGAILNEKAGILDDLITFRMAEDELYVVTNAGPIDAITKRLTDKKVGAVNVSDQTAKIDVQGPLARDVMLQLGVAAAHDLKYFNATWTEWEGVRVLVSRTGYTGELGYEIYTPNDLAPRLWNRLLQIPSVQPAGLGARDTLRTEMGYALSGQDFNAKVTPLEAAMESFIAWDTEFVGKKALLAQRERGDYPVLTAIQSPDRRAPRHGFQICVDGVEIGEVTSGTFGPSVGHGIGLGRLPQDLAVPGVALTVGPKEIPVETTELPFYKNGTCRMQID